MELIKYVIFCKENNLNPNVINSLKIFINNNYGKSVIQRNF